MIFDIATDVNAYMVEGVAPSPYSVTLEGALMHVYELEESYNIMMESIGLSELKYYQETGNDLLLCEASAFAGMKQKIIAWVQSAKQKIIAFYNKFVEFIQSRVADNKRFVKMHGKTLNDIGTFDIPSNAELYDYSGIDVMYDHFENINISSNLNKISGDLDKIDSKAEYRGSVLSDDKIDSTVGELRAKLAGTSDTTISEADMVSIITDICKGNSLAGKKGVKLANYVEIMSNLGDSIKKAKTIRDPLIKSIDAQIKELKGLPDTIKTNDEKTPEQKNHEADRIKAVGCTIKIFKGWDTAIMAAFGAYIAALRASTTTARKICTAALKIKSYKKDSNTATEESARYSASSIDDIFNAVSIY